MIFSSVNNRLHRRLVCKRLYGSAIFSYCRCVAARCAAPQEKRHELSTNARLARGGCFVARVAALGGAPAIAQQSTIGVNAFPNAKALPLHAGIAKGIFA